MVKDEDESNHLTNNHHRLQIPYGGYSRLIDGHSETHNVLINLDLNVKRDPKNDRHSLGRDCIRRLDECILHLNNIPFIDNIFIYYRKRIS